MPDICGVYRRAMALSIDLPELLPEEYPWISGGETVLLSKEGVLPMVPAPGRRLGQALVDYIQGIPERLNKVMVLENASIIDARSLVIAVGSNADPRVIKKKYHCAGSIFSIATPFMRCVITGLSVGHSAHVAANGYVPAAPFKAPGNSIALVASWFDAQQLRIIDETEPNYIRLLIRADDFPLRLESGEEPDNYYIYVSRYGVISDPTTGTPVPLTSQSELFGKLAGWMEQADLHGPASDVCARLVEEDGAARFQANLSRSGLIRESGLLPEKPQPSARFTYGESRDLSIEKGSLIAAATNNDLHRNGENLIVIHPDTAKNLGIRRHAQLTPGARIEELKNRPSIVVGVRKDERLALHVVQVDQIVRNALGVERQEVVHVEQACPRRNLIMDLLIGRPNYVTCRVESAAPPSVERDACLVDSLVLSLLGVTENSLLVIEGAPQPDSIDVPTIRIRAVIVTDEVGNQRYRLNGGGFEARYPSSSDALGVYPDLPRIFLDAKFRNALGLGSHKLVAVRVRASRWDQTTREARELLLVLALSFIGIAGSLKDILALLTFAGVAVMALLVTRSRLRGQLSAQARILRRRRIRPTRRSK